MLAVVGWASVTVGLLLFASRFPRTRWQPHVVVATFAGYAPVPLTMGAALVGAGRGAWPLPAALLAMVMLVQAAPRLRRRTPGEPTLTVLTANLWCGRGDAAALVGLVREHRVDLLAVQELTDEAVAALVAAGVDQLLPHRVLAPAPDWEGAGLWSRFPLRDEQVSRRGTLYRVSAVVAVTGVPLPSDPEVTSVHVHAPWPGPAAPWADQLEELAAHLAAAERPCVVAGDFNATLGHAAFRRLLRTCSDAAVSARAWSARTWPRHLPIPAVIAIDHVLLRGLAATRVWAHDVPGSDHRAVVAAIRPAR